MGFTATSIWTILTEAADSLAGSQLNHLRGCFGPSCKMTSFGQESNATGNHRAASSGDMQLYSCNKKHYILMTCDDCSRHLQHLGHGSLHRFHPIPGAAKRWFHAICEEQHISSRILAPKTHNLLKSPPSEAQGICNKHPPSSNCCCDCDADSTKLPELEFKLGCVRF